MQCFSTQQGRAEAFFAIFLLILCCNVCFGQYFTIDEIKQKSPYNSHAQYIFPHLKCKANHRAAEAINQNLLQEILDIDSGQHYKSIFERVWGTGDWSSITRDDIYYEEVNNDSDFFSISFATGAVGGAYPTTVWQYFTYESRTGREIKLGELFSKSGLNALSDSVNYRRNKLMQDDINTLEDSLKKEGVADTTDDPGEYRGTIEALINCKDSDLVELSFDADYTLDKKSITIFTASCLPHVVMALDVNYIFKFDLATIKSYLSDYGKALLKQ